MWSKLKRNRVLRLKKQADSVPQFVTLKKVDNLLILFDQTVGIVDLAPKCKELLPSHVKVDYVQYHEGKRPKIDQHDLSQAKANLTLQNDLYASDTNFWGVPKADFLDLASEYTLIIDLCAKSPLAFYYLMLNLPHKLLIGRKQNTWQFDFQLDVAREVSSLEVLTSAFYYLDTIKEG